MAGCRSCSGRVQEPLSRSLGKAEKLEKGERSDNPRYPHVFVGKQAIYSDEEVQMIVKVVADDSDAECDSFTLKPQHVLKNTRLENSVPELLRVTQPAGDCCWKLQGLI